MRLKNISFAWALSSILVGTAGDVGICQAAGAGPACVVAPLTPVLECVTHNPDGTYTAYFGYQNNTAGTITHAAGGSANKFSPMPKQRGQPSDFPPGNSPLWPQAAFSVVFDGSPLTWKLDDQTVTASADSQPCARQVTLTKAWYDAEGLLLACPPADLPVDYMLVATSAVGVAVGTYPTGACTLVVKYYNPVYNAGGQACLPVVSAVFAPDNRSVTAHSSKDLSNVVLAFADGTRQKFDGLSGYSATLAGTGTNAGKQVIGLWIKSGCNSSGAGPGYGEYVDNPAIAGGQDDQPGDDSLRVPPGTAYEVREFNLPTHWAAVAGVGRFTIETGPAVCGEGAAEKFCTHAVQNQQLTPPEYNSALGDLVWADRDGDGIQDADEPAIPGVGVVLVLPDGQRRTNTTTGAGYFFDRLAAGAYQVLVLTNTLPAGLTPTWDYDGVGTPHRAAVLLSSAQTNRLIDFGYQGLACATSWQGTLGPDQALCTLAPQWITITGRVALTPPRSLARLQTSWRVVYPAAADVCPPAVTNCQDTQYASQWICDSNTFTIMAWWPGLRCGDPVVEIHYGLNVLDCAGNPITNGVGRDLYWYPWVCAPPCYGVLGDRVWHDANGDCVQDPGETGISGARVWLRSGAGVASATTDVNGAYAFAGLAYGVYTVAVDAATIPAGWVGVCPPAPHVVVLTNSTPWLAADFGYRPQVDLEVTKTATVPPAGCLPVGSNVTFLVTVSNRGPATATNVRLADALAPGLELATANASQGAYAVASGVWLVGDLPAGRAATLAMTVLLTGAGPITNTAEISACDQADADSTPRNGSLAEDDLARITLCAAFPEIKVRPILECVVHTGGGAYTAYFGYRNDGVDAAVIPVGNSNKFSPAPSDRGQPTNFVPGRTPYWPAAAFAVPFDGANLVWTLNSRTSTASSNSTPCSYHVFFEKQWRDADGNLSAAPPADLPAAYRLVATSRLGTALGTYPAGATNLVVTYDNDRPPALDNTGLWVPCCGESYTVTEENLPAGWTADGGTGVFVPAHPTDKFVTHVVTNQDAGSTNFMVDLEIAKAVGYYDWRKTITVDHLRVACALTNFPLLVRLADPDLRHVEYGGHVRHPAGWDLLFRQPTGARLDFEIEHYDPASGNLVAWVRLPLLSAQEDTVILLDYGNGAVYRSPGNPAGVWDRDFVMVQHLAPGPDGILRDATAFGHDGVPSGVTAVTGTLDGAQAFHGPGSGDHIMVAATSNLSFTGSFTIEGWFNWNSGPWTIPISKGEQWVCGDYWLKFDHAKAIFDVMDVGELRMSNSIPAGWHQVVARFAKDRLNMNHMALFVDGELVEAEDNGGTPATCPAPLYLGAYLGTNYNYLGTMDEIRLSRQARPDCWIQTSYRNQSDPASFYAVGAEVALTNGLVQVGETVPFRVALWNNGPQAATDIEVADALRAGLDYVDHLATTGTYGPAAGRWTVSNLAVGATGTLWITAQVTGGPEVPNLAEVMACAETDVDSTPGNGRTNEDDWAAATVWANATEADLELTKTISRYKEFKKITVLHTNFCEPLVDFPMLVVLTDPDLRTVAYGGFVRHPQGFDIIFRDAAGVALAHELEQYDPVAGQVLAWVKIPALSPRDDTVLYMYYGNSVTELPTAEPGRVWDSDFVMVQHLLASSGTVFDATRYAHNGVIQGATPETAGAVGPALAFDGQDDLVRVPASPDLNFSGSFTLETWVKRRSSRWSIPISKGEQWVCGDYWLKVQEDRPNFDVMGVGDETAAMVIPENEWTHVAAVFRRGSGPAGPHVFDIFVNGRLVHFKNKNGPPLTCDTPLYLASYMGSAGFFDGVLDEVRLSKTGRSACWIQAAYRNQADPGAFYLVGAQHAETNAVLDLGDLLDFNIRADNRGPADAYGVHVQDQLPAGLEYITHAASQGSYDPAAGDWAIGSLGQGQSVRLRITARVVRSGGQVNAAEISACHQPDPDSTPDNRVAGEDDYSLASVQDVDGDGLVDEWEEFNFGSLDRDGTADSDGDGASDYVEYLAGTAPMDARERLQANAVNWTAPSAEGIAIYWTSQPFRYYHLSRSTNLLQGYESFLPLATNIMATPPENTYHDEAATNVNMYYYYSIQVVP